MNLEAILALAKGTPHEHQVEDAVRYLHDETRYEQARVPVSAMPNSSVRIASVRKLIADEIVSQVPKWVMKSIGILLEHPEQSKERFRACLDTLGLNVLMQDARKANINGIYVVKRMVLLYSWAVCYDFSAWYYQLPLHLRVQGYFGFLLRGKYYVFKRAAMGCKVMVYVGHTITTLLADTMGRSDSTMTNDVIIDNVMFGDVDIMRLQVTCELFENRCRSVNATIGDRTSISSTAIHRGMFLDFENKTVGIKPTWIKKFIDRCGTALSDGVTFSCWRSLAGMAAWAITVIEFIPGRLYNFFRFVAKHSSRKTSSDKIRADDSTKRELHGLIYYLAQGPRIRPSTCEGEEDSTLATDASCSTDYSGWGAVLYIRRTGRLYIACGKFSAEAHINVLEIRAVREALYAFRTVIEGIVKLYVDNTTAFFTLRNRTSISFQVNTEVMTVISLTLRLSVSLILRWIESGRMPADGLSRGSGFDETDLAKLILLL